MYLCETCGKEFKGVKGKGNKFCGIDCYRTFQKSGNYHIRIKSIKGQCSHCGKDVTRSFSTKRDGSKTESIFCDRNCYDEYRKNIILSTSVKCANCSKEFIPFVAGRNNINNFCKEQCRFDFLFEHVKKKHGVLRKSEDGTKYVKECKICKKEFEVKKQKACTSICSKECLCEFYKTDDTRKQKISKAFQGENHPNYVNGCSYNERVRKTELKEVFSKDDKRAVFKLFNNKCFKCGGNKGLSIDHHIPFSRGGRLTIGNSVLLCRSCNSSKNAKDPKDFYTEKQLNQLAKMGITESSLFFEYGK